MFAYSQPFFVCARGFLLYFVKQTIYKDMILRFAEANLSTALYSYLTK